MRILKDGAKAFGRLGLALTGWVLVVVGVILMPLPGPGLLIVFSGIVVLSTVYTWAKKLRHRLKDLVDKSTRESVASPFRILMSVLGALSLALVGLLLFLDPTLPTWANFTLGPVTIGPKIPFATLPTAIALWISSLLAICLLVYAYIQTKKWDQNDKGPGDDFPDLPI